jgi:hypothetical protein
MASLARRRAYKVRRGKSGTLPFRTPAERGPCDAERVPAPRRRHGVPDSRHRTPPWPLRFLPPRLHPPARCRRGRRPAERETHCRPAAAAPGVGVLLTFASLVGASMQPGLPRSLHSIYTHYLHTDTSLHDLRIVAPPHLCIPPSFTQSTDQHTSSLSFSLLLRSRRLCDDGDAAARQAALCSAPPDFSQLLEISIPPRLPETGDRRCGMQHHPFAHVSL